MRGASGYMPIVDLKDQIARLPEQPGVYLYANAVRTDGCGSATSAVGPFYCPADHRVYLDLSFYEDMRTQLDASGDFAWAYVIAHEMGHHVQNLLGTDQEVARLTRDDPDSANELSVRTELQADCYAGVWAATVFRAGDLEQGDVEEAFNIQLEPDELFPQRLLRDPNYVHEGAITEGGVAKLREQFAFTTLPEIEPGTPVADVAARILTIRVFADYVARVIEKEHA